MSAPLRPAVPPGGLMPESAAYMARTDLRQTRMLGYSPFNLDAVTTLLLGVLGRNPTLRHRGGVTEEGLAFLEEAGLQIEEDMRVFTTTEEAVAHARAMVAEGYRLFWPYPVTEGLYGDAAHLVAPDLWARLNSKETLPQLAPPNALAPRETRPLAALEGVALPVFLKAAGDDATGWGHAVRYCADAGDLGAAQSHFEALGVDRVICEAALDVERCWCANLTITETGVHYLGAAEQTFSAPGQQLGNVIDPDHPLPEAGVALAKEVARKAAEEGFLGVCGFDIGRTVDGEIILFDPNFRFNACTPQILLHAPAVARTDGLTCSQTFAGQFKGPLSELIARLREPVQEGWLVPYRLIDARYMETADGVCHCTAVVLGRDRADVAKRAEALTVALAK
ncbi:hypothetical protein FHY55_08900 [Oceanicola sp. D3]|uniref:hypothetical protein n=1 Tax=Oceanicola sp. D3 TaxID=2587163 RepID=UPI0011207964|nr:hypothetical protein [Oceanicola sp. D3]QDC09354.1 hypothetical protein FHY55_08900 [Oceanicola sp. D3]